MTATQSSLSKNLYYPAPAEPSSLIGLPRLMEMYFRGVDLTPHGRQLIERIERDPEDANALMDLSCLMFLNDNVALGQRLQADALAASRHYQLRAQGRERLRVLALRTAGALMDNMPLEFLLQGSDVTLDLLYLDPADGCVDLAALPPHDVACVAVCDTPATRTLLTQLGAALTALRGPVLNDPARIAATARDAVWQTLHDAPGCAMPPTGRVTRAALKRLAAGTCRLADLLLDATFPIICRPCGSHAGHGLARIDNVAAMARYLATETGEDFFISPFVDYLSPDGQYRKYRIAFVGGQAYPVHMALSARWMVHYLNGDMTGRADNRAEEAQFFDTFERGFALRHAEALAAIDARLGLDCVSIDCGETPDGRLLVFECDIGGVVHAMDPLEGFGYKRPHMLRLFSAFRALLLRASLDPTCLKPKGGAAALQ